MCRPRSSPIDVIIVEEFDGPSGGRPGRSRRCRRGRPSSRSARAGSARRLAVAGPDGSRHRAGWCRRSPPSRRNSVSPSVSRLVGRVPRLCSLRFVSPSLSGSSRSSRRPSLSESLTLGLVPAVNSNLVLRPSLSVSSLSSRMPSLSLSARRGRSPGEVLLTVVEGVPVGILLAVEDAVLVRVLLPGIRVRPLGLPGRREAVLVGIGGGGCGSSGERPDDEGGDHGDQHGVARSDTRTTSHATHGRPPRQTWDPPTGQLGTAGGPVPRCNTREPTRAPRRIGSM